MRVIGVLDCSIFNSINAVKDLINDINTHLIVNKKKEAAE